MFQFQRRVPSEYHWREPPTINVIRSCLGKERRYLKSVLQPTAPPAASHLSGNGVSDKKASAPRLRLEKGISVLLAGRGGDPRREIPCDGGTLLRATCLRAAKHERRQQNPVHCREFER